MKPIILGVFSAFFFAFTFVLNQSMQLNGGSWAWSASLRFFFMLPLLLFVVLIRGNLAGVIHELKKNLWQWLVWSSIGFGIFYSFICFATVYGPGWLIAGTWQLTIISGTLLAPFFYTYTINNEGDTVRVRKKIPFKSLGFSLLIVFGIILMQVEYAVNISIGTALLCLVPIVVASFAYPLGNRKMMELCNNRLDVFQRVLGMTIASMPFWIILSFFAYITSGFPTKNQVVQSSLVAIFSGVLATVLFFAATDLVKDDMTRLGAVEATQSFEVLFALIGEILLLSADLPTPVSIVGILFVMGGMILHSSLSNKTLSAKKIVDV